jgi:hypothetical protein
MTDPVYEKRYCAFIDILGFSELIQTLDKVISGARRSLAGKGPR